MTSVSLKWRAAKVDLPAPDGPTRMINEGSGMVSRNNLFAPDCAADFQALRFGFSHLPFDIADCPAGRPVGRLARRIESGIADALVIDVDQRVDEAFANRR